MLSGLMLFLCSFILISRAVARGKINSRCQIKEGFLVIMLTKTSENWCHLLEKRSEFSCEFDLYEWLESLGLGKFAV